MSKRKEQGASDGKVADDEPVAKKISIASEFCDAADEKHRQILMKEMIDQCRDYADKGCYRVELYPRNFKGGSFYVFGKNTAKTLADLEALGLPATYRTRFNHDTPCKCSPDDNCSHQSYLFDWLNANKSTAVVAPVAKEK